MKLCIYDLESYANFFSADFRYFNEQGHAYFEISDFRDDTQELLEFCRELYRNNVFAIGYRNTAYDYILLDAFLRRTHKTAQELKQLSNEIIETQDKEDKFKFYISPKNRLIKQIDLFKIHHFDNIARQTSLKALQFNMRLPSIEDLPFEPGTVLDICQAETVKQYNAHDVDSTHDFAEHSLEAIKFRAELKRKYPYQDWYNFADTKIGKEYFVMMLEKAGVECYTRTPEGRQPRQTQREYLYLNDAILPWLKFKTPEFQNVLDWLVTQKISETKSVFQDLSATINGFQFDFGTGGIHGSVTREVFESDEEYIIFDIDVKSYYPNLAISNRFYPEHLGEKFCDVYQDLYQERSKHAKGSAINKMLKLALNGVYGESNSPFSVFYDPLFTMKITLNGQLLLCLLSEMIWSDIPDAQLIQINTDGLTVKIKRNLSKILHKVVKSWEKLTGLEMEFVKYSKMFIRDVNNYVAVDVDTNVKRKGAYEYKLEWHKNHSSLVIPKIAEKVLLEGADPTELLESWPDPMDFMIKAKVQRTGKFILQVQEDEYEEIQKTSRAYVSNDGCEMFKLLPPIKGKPEPKKGFFKYKNENWRKIAFMKGRKISVANDLSKINLDEIQIDYDFYLKEINKLTNGLTKEVIHEC